MVTGWLNTKSGVCTKMGGVSRRIIARLYMVSKSWRSGSADAQNQIGWMYQNGLGVAKDYGQALIWYQKAADQSNPSGQINIG